MRKAIIFGLLLWLLAACTAQKQGLKPYHLSMLQEADLLYIQDDYQGAMAIYNHILEANPAHAQANLRAGICRLNIRDQQLDALSYLERAREQQVPEASYYIGLALHFQERFSEAIESMEYYLSSGDNAIPEPEVNKSIKMTRRAKYAYDNARNQRITNLGPEINSPFPDYVPLISADGNHLYFTSRRADGVSKTLDPNGHFFEDIYQSSRETEGWSSAVNLESPVNTEGHDATVALSPLGDKMLIYRTNALLDGGDIYLTEFKEQGWTKPELYSERINSRYFEPSAAISDDERTIYFASNRPGGYGGKDLYRVVKQPDNSWSYPINLGPKINSDGQEDGPYLSANGRVLYFSSTAHGSIGGYDIFRAFRDSESGEWSDPENLGYPVNTVFDDIYMVMESSGNLGYYATNRPGGFGSHDIYEVQFGADDALVVLSGRILDQNGHSVRANLELSRKGKEESTKYRSNAFTGKYTVLLQPDVEYKLTISGADFETLEVELQYQEVFGLTLTEVHRDFVLSVFDQQTSNGK